MKNETVEGKLDRKFQMITVQKPQAKRDLGQFAGKNFIEFTKEKRLTSCVRNTETNYITNQWRTGA